MTSAEQLAVMRLTASVIPAAFYWPAPTLPINYFLSGQSLHPNMATPPCLPIAMAAYGLLCNIIRNGIL